MTMSQGPRLRGVSLARGVIFGNSSQFLGNKRVDTDSSHTHKWCVYFRSATGEDLTTFVKRVVFRLHDSFESPIRSIERPPFEVTESGWGEFEVIIEVHFQDATEKPLRIPHFLTLFPTDTTVQLNKRIMVQEVYDEIVFNEPHSAFHDRLVTASQSSRPRTFTPSTAPAVNYDELEKSELEKLELAKLDVNKELKAIRSRYIEADEMAKRLTDNIIVVEEELQLLTIPKLMT